MWPGRAAWSYSTMQSPAPVNLHLGFLTVRAAEDSLAPGGARKALSASQSFTLATSVAGVAWDRASRTGYVTSHRVTCEV